MINNIEVKPAEDIHYSDMLRVYNEGFLPKYSFVTKNKNIARVLFMILLLQT